MPQPTEKPFSTVRFLEPSEIGHRELEMLYDYQQHIGKIAGIVKKKDTDLISNVANGNTTHFVTEYFRINKFFRKLSVQP